jgi:hypothetical protein
METEVTPAVHNGKWKPGQSGNPNGRPVGIKGALTRFERRQREIAEATGAMPIEILLAYARRDPEALARFGIPLEEATYGVSRWALQIVLPYTARKLPELVIDDENTLSPAMNAAIASLTDREIQFLGRLLQRAEVIREHIQKAADEEEEQGSDDD